MTQLGELQEHLSGFRQRGATVVAVCNDPVARNQTVADRLQLGFPILSDPTRTTIRAFGVEDAENGIAWPAVFVLGADGRVRWRSLSDDYAHRPTAATLLAVLDAPAAR